MMKTPVNKYTLRNHFTYNWWKYLLAILAGTVLVSLLFTVTAPRVPDNKKVEFYIYGLADAKALDAYMNRVHEEDLPDMEVVSALTMIQDENYGPMQLTTYIAVGEGDVYLLPRDEFISMAGSGAFLPLERDEALMAFFTDAGIDLRRGWRTLADSDETHLYGIPADLLPSLSTLCYAKNGYLAVLLNGGNTDNTLRFLRRLCRDMIAEPEGAAPEASPEAVSVPSAAP